jgi:hypothetical protein
MNKNGVINASFELRNFKVRTVAVGNGTVSMERFVSINNKKNVENVTRIAKVKRSSHLTNIDYGSQLVYHVEPEPGHYIKKFLVDGKRIKTIDTVTFANIKRNHRIRVRFASIPESTFQAHLKVVGKQIVLQDDEDRGHLQTRTNDPGENDDDNPIVQSSTDNYAYLRQ